jgi:ABC-type nitrate/sulfonate/bicarbonate transport system substrate-binding protein
VTYSRPARSARPGRPGLRTLTAATLVTATVASLAACGEGSGADQASSYDGDIGTTDLSASCPSNIVVQTDWFPEAEHGHLYEQLDYAGKGKDEVKIDADKKTVSGPLFDGDNGYTGVNLEIRSGGPAIGNQSVTSQMYQDQDILLGYVDSDQTIQQSATKPTLGVMTTLDKSPQMIMWDPATYPDVKTIADLKAKKATVLTFADMSYVKYLTGAGILDESQIDQSYDGAPATFVAAGGKKAQQGYSSSEPYNYENTIDGWKKPVSYQLLHDAGFPTYKSSLAVRTDAEADNAGCLKKLIPVLQRGEKAYMADPGAANDLIVKAVSDFNSGWVYDQGNADYGVKKMRDEALVADGSDGTLGSFDPGRLQKVTDILTPIFAKQNTPVKDGLTTDQIGTNRYLDPSISLG